MLCSSTSSGEGRSATGAAALWDRPYGIGIEFCFSLLKHPSCCVYGVRQLLEAVAGGGFADPSKGKLLVSASQLERLKTVRNS